MSSSTGCKTGGRMKFMLNCYSALFEIYFDCSPHHHELPCSREVLVTSHIPGTTSKVGTVAQTILTRFWKND